MPPRSGSHDLPWPNPRLESAAGALADLDVPPADAALAPADLRPLLFQWLAVLEAAEVAELEGLTDDLRALAEHLDEAPDPASPGLCAALHRAGLSLERVAALAGAPPITSHLLRLGERLVAAGEAA